MERHTGKNESPRADAPLNGVRVVEVALYMQAATCTLILAELGADVVKIERPGHRDYVRDISTFYGIDLDEDGRRWLYSALNRNKRSLALDIASADGRPAFERLLRNADVFVTNLRPDALKNLRIDADSIFEINPEIVYAVGGGYGFDGPLSNRASQDTVSMAYSGFMDTVSAEDEPYYPPGAMSDILTGTNLAGSILAGLVTKARGASRVVVRSSQLQSLMWMQLLNVGVGSLGEKMARFSRNGNHNPLLSLYETSDGWVALAVIHQHQWTRLVDAMGLQESLGDARFSTLESILSHSDLVVSQLSERFAASSTNHWVERLTEADLWISPVQSAADLVDDAQAVANGYVTRSPEGFSHVSLPFEVGDWRPPPSSASDHGEQSDEILRELGFNEAEIVALRVSGALW